MGAGPNREALSTGGSRPTVGGVAHTVRMPTARPRRATPAPSYLDSALMSRFPRALRDQTALRTFLEDAQVEGQQAIVGIERELTELRAQLTNVDPLRTLSALHVLDAMRRDRMPGPANFGSDAMLDLLATVVCSEPETEALKRIEEEFEPGRIWVIEQVLRRIANLLLTAELGRTFRDRSDGQPTPLLSMLRLENAFDRMAGFDPHVRRVVIAVFSRADERVKAARGFALSDSLAFSSLYEQVQLARVSRTDEVMAASTAPVSFADRDEEVQWKAGHMLYFALNAASPVEGGTVDDWIAEQLELSEDQFAALVAAMATNLGSVDPDKVMQDTSFRNRPVVRLSSGEWMWPRPIDFLHGAMEWALDVCKGDQSLLRVFDSARQSVAEELTADLLEDVFGPDRVFRNVSYPDTESNAENDTIVSLPGLALLVETKGGRFSAPGRRAAPLRVQKHAKELVEDAAKQNRRTAAAIADGRQLTAKDGRRVPVVPEDQVIPIVVTLDRVDPFSTYLGEPPRSGTDGRNWVINISDLVMLADILPTPEEFVAYARTRLTMVREGVRVFVEADCLGHWCADRTAKVREVADPHGNSVRLVGETADFMNDYFTQVTLDQLEPDASEHRRRVHKPTTGIPDPVLRAVRAVREQGSPDWVDLADRVASVSPESWRPMTRLLAAIERRTPREPGRQLLKRIRRAEGGLTVDGQVVVTLVSAESADLRVTALPGAES